MKPTPAARHAAGVVDWIISLDPADTAAAYRTDVPGGLRLYHYG